MSGLVGNSRRLVLSWCVHTFYRCYHFTKNKKNTQSSVTSSVVDKTFIFTGCMLEISPTDVLQSGHL